MAHTLGCHRTQLTSVLWAFSCFSTISYDNPSPCQRNIKANSIWITLLLFNKCSSNDKYDWLPQRNELIVHQHTKSHVHPDIIKAGTHMGECSSKSYRKSGDVVPKFIKYTYAIISCSTGNQAIHPSTPHTYRFRISQSFEISSTLFLLLWIYCKVMAALSFIIFFHSSLQVLHDCLLASQFPVYNKGGHITFSSHK
jgi:hypothetical protein